MRWPKAARLLRRREYLAVQERGARLHAGAYLVLGLRNECGRARVGITVSSKVANAVVRNRVRRWVREAFRPALGELPPMDLVVIARAGAGAAGIIGARAAVEGTRAALARGA
jgi:ribonuclease P protein component